MSKSSKCIKKGSQRCIKTFAESFSFHFIFIYLGTVAPSVHENCFSGGRGTNVTSLRFDSSLKGGKRWCLLTSSSRLFQSLGPRKDIALCPLLVFRKGIERSVSLFLSSLTFRVDLSNIHRRAFSTFKNKRSENFNTLQQPFLLKFTYFDIAGG